MDLNRDRETGGHLDSTHPQEHEQEQAAGNRATLLLVDDTPGVHALLSRALRSHGYRVLTADGGAQGLALMAGQDVDLVISDMSMPGMDGADFLAAVRKRWPDTVRILLTGNSDINATIAAINRGEIYRYISKPWRDGDVLLLVRQALEVKGLARDKARLEALTQAQNLELKALNAGLENIVALRTAALQKAMESLQFAHNRLKNNFNASIAVFSNLIELRLGKATGKSRRIADWARRIAKRLKIAEAAQQDIVVAALLRDIGQLTLPDHLLDKPLAQLCPEDQIAYSQHPATGEAALMSLDRLDGAAHLIRSQLERWDGKGYPDRLRARQIPLGSRILSVARDYERLQNGSATNVRLSATDAQRFIVADSGRRYDPEVVDAFIAISGVKPARPAPLAEKYVPAEALASGMVLARDLITEEGVLLLSREHILDSSLIHKLRSYEHRGAKRLDVSVRVAAEMV